MSTGIVNPLIVQIEVTADATGGVDYVLPREGWIQNVVVLCTATNAGGTAQLLRSTGGPFAAVSAALTCDTANEISRAASLTLSQIACAAGDTLRIVTNGAADRCVAHISIQPPNSGA